MSSTSHRRVLGLTMIATILSACSDPGPTRITAPGASRVVAPVSSAAASPGWQELARTLVAGNSLSTLDAARLYAGLSVAQYLAVVEADGHFDVEGEVPQTGLGSGGRQLLEA